MKTADQLRQFYESELRGEIRDLEVLRRAARGRTLLAVVVGLAAALSFALFTSIGAAAIVLGIALLIPAIWLAVQAYKRYTLFRDQFKQRVVRSIVRFVDPDFSYRPDGRIDKSSYDASGIFRKGVDRYNGDDLVSGRIDKTEFSFSELHTEYKTTSTDSKGNRRERWHTIFRGLFFIADFNKHFRGETFVLPDKAERMFGFLGTKLQKWNWSHGDLVKLEDPEFEKAFVVYGNDQVEARYILSPALMERIMAFKAKAGHEIHLSFAHSRVNVAISFRRELFEASLYGPMLDLAKVRTYLDDLQLALGIVEDLNLNTRIWSKS